MWTVEGKANCKKKKYVKRFTGHKDRIWKNSALPIQTVNNSQYSVHVTYSANWYLLNDAILFYLKGLLVWQDKFTLETSVHSSEILFLSAF